jgi:histidine ammonia-lyase
LHSIIEEVRPFPGLAATLGRLRALLSGSYLRRVAAIEFVVAAQAIDLRARPGLPGAALGPLGPAELGLGIARAYRMIRELVPFTSGDGTLPADLEPQVTTGTLTPPAA